MKGKIFGNYIYLFLIFAVFFRDSSLFAAEPCPEKFSLPSTNTETVTEELLLYREGAENCLVHAPEGLPPFIKKVPGGYWLHADSPEIESELLRMLTLSPHTSEIIFDGGEVPPFRLTVAAGGRTVSLVKPEESKQLVEKIAGRGVVFWGERHDSYAQHLAQAFFLESLLERGYNVNLLLEMFSRDQQNILDKWNAGKLSEKEFLKQIKYFDVWGFDYRLYRPLFLLREKYPGRITYRAANLRREITRKVARGGTDALSQEEWQELPPQPWVHNADYEAHWRNFFTQMFSSGMHSSVGSVENYLFAQKIWDETMAESVARSAKEQKKKEIIVLIAGEGHMVSGGIPERWLAKAGDKDFARIEALAEDELEEPEDGHLYRFGVIDQELPPLYYSGLRLMASEDKIVVLKTPESGPLSFLHHGDILISIGEEKVESVNDALVELSFQSPDTEGVKMTILRRGQREEYEMLLPDAHEENK